MFLGGALLSTTDDLFIIISAAIGIIGGFYFRWIKPVHHVYLFFFFLVLASGFAIWLQNN